MLTTYGFVSSNPACQESTLTTSLDTSDALFGQKKDALGKLGVKASGQIWDVAHGQEPSKLLLPYFRIAAMDDVQQLQRADAALQGEISEDNERRAKEGLAATIATRRKDLREARSRAQQARDAGKDVFVRAQVAELVGELLDSEEAALDDFTTRMKL